MGDEPGLIDAPPAGCEQRALSRRLLGDAAVVGEPLRSQLDRMTAAQDGLHNLRREEAEPQDARDCGACDACALAAFLPPAR
jgi:hypothetical protein